MSELRFIAKVSKLTAKKNNETEDKETVKMLLNIPQHLWPEAEQLRGKQLKVIVTEATI